MCVRVCLQAQSEQICYVMSSQEFRVVFSFNRVEVGEEEEDEEEEGGRLGKLIQGE